LALVCSMSVAFAQDRPTDQWLTKPVDEATFNAYLEFFTYDAGVPFDATIRETTNAEGVRRERLSFQSTPGERVTALLYYPTGLRLQTAPAVVFLHGGVGQGKDQAYHVRFAEFLARAGITVLAIDLPHFGERADGFLTSFDEKEKHDRLYNNDTEYLEWIQQTVKDVGRAFDYLVGRGVDRSRIGLAGLSRGAVAAAIAGGADRRFGAVALLHVGHFDYFEDGHRAAACPANYIGHISPRPLFMLSAEHDQDFLPDYAIRPLQRLAREPKTIRWNEGGHAFTTDEDRSALAEWLRKNLP